jgi:hypothetical protein
MPGASSCTVLANDIASLIEKAAEFPAAFSAFGTEKSVRAVLEV